MVHHVHIPSPGLQKYLKCIVYNKDFYPDHSKDKYLPDGTFNIVFELSGNPKHIYHNETDEIVQTCRDVWFSGVLKDYLTISAECEEMIVVVFKPGAGYPLLHQSMVPFTNKVVPATEIFGDSIHILLADIRNLNTYEEKIALIESWIKDLLIEDDFYMNIIQYAVNEIEQSPSQIKLSILAEKTGYSQKQFIMLFKKYVGITPKQFHRIVRFNEILSSVEMKKLISWTDVAYNCGYFDQAHFIKDFQSFSGLNPKQYVNDIGDFPNFFPVK